MTETLVVSIGLPELVAALIVVALTAYALSGGADFGGGVWDLLATGPRKEEQRAHIASSLAPIWEANHVWLIVVVVMLFTAFPAAFSTIAIVLHIPLAAMLVGIVLRGSAFVFRSYGSKTTAARGRWGAVFAGASIVTPFLLGDVIGALASGAVGNAAPRVTDPAASFADVYLAPWIAPFPIVMGLFALALFAFLAAVYLAYNAPSSTVDATAVTTGDAEHARGNLREDFRKRALAAAAAVFLFAVISLLISDRHAPRVSDAMKYGVLSIPFQVGTAIAAIAAIVALWRRNYRLARIAAGAQVTAILWGWAWAQFPFIVPDVLSIRAAAAPQRTLELLVIGLAAGAAILIPALRYLLRLFARRPT